MKKFFKFLFLVTFIFSFNFNISFASHDISNIDDKKIFSTGEFETVTASSNNSLEKDIISDEQSFKSYSLDSKDSTLSKDEIIYIILNDPEFTEYIETELEHIYNSLTNFVLEKPEILKNFKTSLDITEPNEITDFFKSLISCDDVKDCLISLLDDDELLEIFETGNLDSLLDAFYDTLNNKLV